MDLDSRDGSANRKSTAKKDEDTIRSRLCDWEIQERVLTQLTPYQRKLLGDQVDDDQVAQGQSGRSGSENINEMKGTKLFNYILQNFQKDKKPRPETFEDIEFKDLDKIYNQLFVSKAEPKTPGGHKDHDQDHNKVVSYFEKLLEESNKEAGHDSKAVKEQLDDLLQCKFESTFKRRLTISKCLNILNARNSKK